MRLFQRSPAVPEVTPAEAHQRVADGQAILVDVREAWEWQQGHAARARHIPLGDLPGKLSTLPPEKDVMVICASGNRSKQAARHLNAQGLRASSVAGGTRAWVAGGLETAR